MASTKQPKSGASFDNNYAIPERANPDIHEYSTIVADALKLNTQSTASQLDTPGITSDPTVIYSELDDSKVHPIVNDTAPTAETTPNYMDLIAEKSSPNDYAEPGEVWLDYQPNTYDKLAPADKLTGDQPKATYAKLYDPNLA